MKNIILKSGLALSTLMLMTTLAKAGSLDTVPLPEPGTFGMFAGAVAVAIIAARLIKK